MLTCTKSEGSLDKDGSSTCSDTPAILFEKSPTKKAKISGLLGLVDRPDHQLESKLKKMKKAAWKVRENAYCPYSGFKVGASMRSAKTGKIYAGCNVENAAFPTGICAERGALCAAVASEGPNVKFDEIVVVTENHEPAAPCGVCRQMMIEFGVEANVNCYNHEGMKTRLTLDEYLPNSFGPHSFK
jgi:cytidine deaminase